MRLRRGLSFGAIAAAFVAGAIALSGCGAGNVIDPVARAATVSNQSPGMKLLLAMRISTSTLPAPITATGGGTFDTAARSGAFNLAMDFGNIPLVAQVLGSSTLRLQEIVDGLTVYVKFPPVIARSMGLGDKPWVKINVASAAAAAGIPGLGALTSNPTSSDPSQLLRYLRATSGSVTKVGTEAVDGVQTTHYRAQIQLDRVPDGFPPASRSQVRQTISALERLAHVRTLPADVWIDGHHLVRRMALSFDETVSGQSLTTAMRIDIPQYGPQPAPQLPPGSQVTDLTDRVGSSAANGAASVGG
jgi:hypothetical protein